jgi:molybdenum cofactor biosynthesis protein B
MSEHPVDQKTRANFALVITSDTRTRKEDETGRVAYEYIEAEGHSVVSHSIIPNDEERIRAEVQRLVFNKDVQVIITSGGTGIGSKDKTVAAIMPVLDKDMPGFGETFRRISYDEIGGPAIMSRASAGVVSGKLVFILPGSRNAVKLALTRLILPNIGHMLWELKR